MTDTERAAALLETAQWHMRTVSVCVDQLTVLNAKPELRIITHRLLELAWKAEPSPHTIED